MSLGCFFFKLQMFNIQMVHNLKGIGQLHVGLFSIFNWPVLFAILAFWGKIQFKFQRCYSFESKARNMQTIAFNGLCLTSLSGSCSCEPSFNEAWWLGISVPKGPVLRLGKAAGIARSGSTKVLVGSRLKCPGAWAAGVGEADLSPLESSGLLLAPWRLQGRPPARQGCLSLPLHQLWVSLMPQALAGGTCGGW